VLRYALLATGLLVGLTAAFSYLNYRGNAPLNVSVYFGGFVLTQVLVLMLLLTLSMVRMKNRSFLHSSVLYLLISDLLVKLMLKVRRRALQSLTGSSRGSLEGVIGIIKGKRQIYGGLFYLPVFLLVQFFGTGFNLGVVSATLLKVVGSDVAFGWQSTVQFGSRLVFDLVRAVSTPWSWFVPADIAHPSLSEIEGSRMVLKEGIYHLSTQDLVSWWPFLTLAVLFYGLLPRMILLGVGLIVQNRMLGGLAFDHGACERLLQRMRTPLVRTEGSSPSVGRIESEDGQGPEPAVQGPGISDENKGLIAMVPADIFDQCPAAELDKVVSRRLGCLTGRKLRFGEDERGDREILEELSLLGQKHGSPNVLILQEAWLPPIKETLNFIRDLRKTIGETAKIEVGLIGRPVPDTIFTPVRQEDRRAWQKRLGALGDPYLHVERLVADEDSDGS